MSNCYSAVLWIENRFQIFLSWHCIWFCWGCVYHLMKPMPGIAMPLGFFWSPSCVVTSINTAMVIFSSIYDNSSVFSRGQSVQLFLSSDEADVIQLPTWWRYGHALCQYEVAYPDFGSGVVWTHASEWGLHSLLLLLQMVPAWLQERWELSLVGKKRHMHPQVSEIWASTYMLLNFFHISSHL